MNKRRQLPVVALVAAGVLSLLACGLGSSLTAGDLSDPTDDDRAAASETVDGEGLDVVRPVPPLGAVGGPGLIEPRNRPTELALDIGGLVDVVEVEEGGRIAAGDALLRLDSAVAEAERDGALADERAARAERDAAAADARAAAERAALSDDVRRRAVTLAERGAATADEADRAVRTAEADAEAARAADLRVTQAEARLGSAVARRVLAERRVEQRILRAPSDAEVLQVLVRPGEYVAPGSAVVVTGDTDVLRARLDIDERDVSRVAVGQPGWVRVEGLEGRWEGRVLSIGRRVGRKNVRSDDPTDRQDARFVEVVLSLEEAPPVPVGVRVEGTIDVGADS